ncbi:MAG TPA: hypothetical protein VFT45_00560 [Longimicrobium sp.]|nr:hypothetical protein [Longimicrobium sp.]
MRVLIRNPVRPLCRAAAALVCTGALAGCSDWQPLELSSRAAPAPPPSLVQAFDCTATTAGTVSCRPPAAHAGQASRIVYGGQGVNVQITSSNVSYNSGTEIFQFDVTVQNLLNEAIGTPDGTVADPQGIRVFFATGPTVTSGTGSAYVANPDGTDTFTAPGQPYFAYAEILAKNEVSAARTWQLHIPSTAGSFSFTLLVETDVQYLLVINEVLANPGGAITDANGEWFEVYNAGTFAVDLQNLVIADSASTGRRPYHVITSSIPVPSGGYRVLGNITDTTGNGGVPVDYPYGSALLLANSVDAVKISRVYGTDTLTLDRVAYASAAISTQNGVSRELINPALDNANVDGSNWAGASVSAVYGAGGRGTPGAQNSAFVP